MKRYTAFLCALLILIFSIPPVYADNGSTIVYITRTGECYHRGDCYHLRQSKISISLEDATRRGYRPCSHCSPPIYDGGKTASSPSSSSSTSSSRNPQTPSYSTSKPSTSTSKPNTSTSKPTTSTSSSTWQDESKSTTLHDSTSTRSSSNPLLTIVGIAGVGGAGYLIGRKKRN